MQSPYHGINACRANIAMAQLIHTFGARWTCVGNFTPGPLCAPVLIEQQLGWNPEPDCTFSSKTKIAPSSIGRSFCPARTLACKRNIYFFYQFVFLMSSKSLFRIFIMHKNVYRPCTQCQYAVCMCE